MTALSKHELGQMRHLDLLAMVIRAGAAPSEAVALRMGTASKEHLIGLLSRGGAS